MGSPWKPSTFFGEVAKARIKEIVAELELGSAVEVVVAVHPRSGNYRETEYLLGCVFAMMWLAFFLYYPDPFDFTFLPLEMMGAFAAGALVVRAVAPVKRCLTPRAVMAREVDRAAKAAFYDLSIARTRARTGVLVFVSVLEGSARVVKDVGVPRIEGLSTLAPRLDQAVRRGDIRSFTGLLGSLAATWTKALPKRADDINELPDAPIQAGR
ncbi:MAG: hypothetical protein HOW73_05895 [Polyangiaceae bacterium]|nr:hypothetical protein [Polyangiaceae bacterium]